MIKEFCDLHNEEFRNLLIFNLRHLLNVEDIIEIIKKEKITNNDILRFYFKCSKRISTWHYIIETLFNYKMNRISDERVIKFKTIIKQKYPTKDISANRIGYIELMYSFSSPLGFYELVDIFLDEI